jgi:hypothetical protein
MAGKANWQDARYADGDSTETAVMYGDGDGPEITVKATRPNSDAPWQLNQRKGFGGVNYTPEQFRAIVEAAMPIVEAIEEGTLTFPDAATKGGKSTKARSGKVTTTEANPEIVKALAGDPSALKVYLDSLR